MIFFLFFFKHKTHDFFNQLKFFTIIVLYLGYNTQNAVSFYWTKTKLQYLSFLMNKIFYLLICTKLFPISYSKVEDFCNIIIIILINITF